MSKSSDETKVLACFGVLALLPVVLIFSSLWRGFVLNVLWAWFVVPKFGLPPLGIGYAIGLSIIVSFLTMPYNDKKKEQDEEEGWGPLIKAIATAILLPAFSLGMGWVVHEFTR